MAYQVGQFLITVGIGFAGAVIGVALLWFLLRRLRLGEVLGTSAQLACVVGVVAGCDMAREDAGLLAAIVMGLAVANMRGFDAPAQRLFFETLVQLIIWCAVRLHLGHRDAGLAGAPRSADARPGGRPGAGDPPAGGLGGHCPDGPDERGTSVHRVDGPPWHRRGGHGVDVLGPAGAKQRIRRSGLELAPGELLWAATSRGAQLEGITAVLLLTEEDDFNALASANLAGSVEGPVYRLGARLPSHGVVAPYTGGETLLAASLTRYEVGRRSAAGGTISTRPARCRTAVGPIRVTGLERRWRALVRVCGGAR